VLIAEAANTIDLRQHLGDLRRPRPDVERDRRRLAHGLGEMLAQLHLAGFHHHDLYAKHILIDPATGRLTVLDWQRARLHRGAIDWAARLRDLAALHATVPELLATDRERLVCLRSYLKTCGDESLSVTMMVRRINELALELLQKRHVREVRTARPIDEQGVLWLDGEALCVTPEFHAELRGHVPNWLRSPAAPKVGFTQTVVPLAGGRRGLLTWRRRWTPLTWLWSLLWPRPLITPEVREAGLLFRRKRQGQSAARLLAFGQRSRFPGHTESFLLTELPHTDQARRSA
jgi:hypothetical protein